MKRTVFAKLCALGLLAVGALATHSPALAMSRCTTALIEEQFLLPDGTIHEPGELRICFEQRYSPVASLDKTHVNGAAIGVFVARQSELGSESREPFMVFERDDLGRMCLRGYGRRDGDRTLYSAFDHPSVKVEAGAFRVSAAVHESDRVDDPGWIVIPGRA